MKFKFTLCLLLLSSSSFATVYSIVTKHDTAANWASNNPILLSGVQGFETDTKKIKFGDGSTHWTGLAYASGPPENYAPAFGTLTNGDWCTTNGTTVSCTQAAPQAVLTYPVTGVASPSAGQLVKWDVSGNKIVDALKIGSFTDGDYCKYSTATGIDCTAAGSGSGSMTYPGAGIPLSTGSAWGTSITETDSYVIYGSSSAWGKSNAPAISATNMTSFPTLNQSTSGTAAKATVLETARAIYGNNFDGSVAISGIIASTYGGTGNGFTKFSGPTTSEKTFTLPNANTTLAANDGSNLTISGQAIGDIPVASSTTAYGKLAAVATGNILVSAGTGTAPAYSTAIPNGVTATTQSANSGDTKVATNAYADQYNPVLAIANGGTISAWNSYSVATGATTFTLPATIIGKQACFRQQNNTTNAISITPPTSSYVEAQAATSYCTVSHAIKSGGAVGDSICFVAIDSTHWMIFGGAVGTWTCQ